MLYVQAVTMGTQRPAMMWYVHAITQGPVYAGKQWKPMVKYQLKW